MSDNEWVMVPRMPDEAMFEAALRVHGEDALLARSPALLSALLKIYCAMLAAAPQPKEARPSPEGVGEEGRQLLPSGWRVSVHRGLPGVLYLSIEGPGCSTRDQASTFDDVKRRVYKRFEQALATQQEQDEGPEGEDGPWAEGWEERSRPVANPFTPPCKCVCHSMKAGMVHSHACCVSPVTPTQQEQDSREGHEPMVDWWLKACDWPVDKGFTWQDMPDEHDPCYVYMPCGGGLEFCHHAKNGVDQARAQFVTAACNAYLSSHHPAAPADGDGGSDVA